MLEDQLKHKDRIIQGLEEEVKSLADKITNQTEDCAMGVWCEDCKHLGEESSRAYTNIEKAGFFSGIPIITGYYKSENGIVKYCKKHLHEICNEFELKSK